VGLPFKHTHRLIVLFYQKCESVCGILTTPTPPPSRRKFIEPQIFQFEASCENKQTKMINFGTTELQRPLGKY
jgi:hypothetical protein